MPSWSTIGSISITRTHQDRQIFVQEAKFILFRLKIQVTLLQPLVWSQSWNSYCRMYNRIGSFDSAIKLEIMPKNFMPAFGTIYRANLLSKYIHWEAEMHTLTSQIRQIAHLMRLLLLSLQRLWNKGDVEGRDQVTSLSISWNPSLRAF